MFAFAVAAMVPLVVFWLWPYSSILDRKYAEVRERHLLIANNLGAAMETYHRDIVVAIESLAPSIAEGKSIEAKPIFANLNFRHICVFDNKSGTLSQSYLDEDKKCPQTIPANTLSLFEQLVPTSKVATSGVMIPDGGRPQIFLFTETGSSLVVAAIYTDFFRALQERISFGRLGHAAIVDHTGRVLAHPREEWVATAHDMSQLPPVRRMIAGETGVETFMSPALSLDMIAGFTAVPGPGWGVMVPQPIREFEDAAHAFNRDALIILSIGLVLSLLLAASVSNLFSGKIEDIENQVHNVRKGRLLPAKKITSEVIGIRELSALRDGVDTMARTTIQAREDSLKHTQELEDANALLRREIDDREIAEAQRARSEARFQGMFDNAPIPIREEDFSEVKKAIDALGIKDPKQFEEYLNDHPGFVRACGDKVIVLNANRASVALHKFPDKAQMLTQVATPLSPESFEILRQILVVIHSGETKLSYQVPIYPISGEMRHMQAAWMVLPGHENTYRRILLSSIDLTERVKSEKRLHKAQKMEAVGQLTGGIAHDFNNLLTVIGGNVDLIQEDISHAADYVQPIQSAVARGSELTQRLLAFSRQQPLTPKVIDLIDLITEMTELLGRTLGEDVEVKFHHDPDLWATLADPNQVENALLNLGLNARDAMPVGGTLSIECQNVQVSGRDADEMEDGDYVMISVSDNGTGMPPKVASHAFEPFFTTKAVGKGSGLGLSMVYGFAKQSKGHADIESTPGQGTTIRVYLPRGIAQSEQITRSIPALDFPKGDGQSVLVLEDQDDVRTYLIRLLELMGYTPLPARNAYEAQGLLKIHSDIRVAVCDIMMPGGMSGTEFAAQVMENDPDFKVIFISGHTPEHSIATDSILQDCVLLTKPFDSRLLGELLHRYVRSQSTDYVVSATPT